MAEPRTWGFMPRWPKPHIRRAHGKLWIVIFGDPRFPCVRHATGHHARTVDEAWRHVAVMCDWHLCPLPKGYAS